MKPKHPTIPMSGVKSSQIESLGHMGDTLAVKFRSGGATYHYPGVSQEQFAALQKAESLGSHFSKHIRSKFQGVKIDPQ